MFGHGPFSHAENLFAAFALAGTTAGSFVGVPTAYEILSARAPELARVAPEMEPAAIVEPDPSASVHSRTIMRAADGFFYVDVTAGARRLNCLIDTGASMLTLSSEAAPRLGLDPQRLRYDRRLIGAGGSMRSAVASIGRLDIAGRSLTAIHATIVRGGGAPCLVGQQLLRRLGALHLEGDEIHLGRGGSPGND